MGCAYQNNAYISFTIQKIKIMPFWAIAAPILAQVAQNVLQGMNTRKARLYDSPAQQVKRYTEAGFPMAAASNINGGGGFTTQASVQDPTPSIQQNLGASLKREIDRKQIDLLRQSIRSAQSAADIAGGEAKNKLNPKGVFENTNQGYSMMNAQSLENNAVKMQETLNKYLPIEKDMSLQKMGVDIRSIEQNIKNMSVQNSILVSEGKIKNILANYQESMSSEELKNLIKRNTGLDNQNRITDLQGDILWATKQAQITTAINRALESGQDLQAKQLAIMLQALQNESARTYYKVKARVDYKYQEGGTVASDMLYLGMFNQQNATYNPAQIIGGISNHFNQ